MVASLVTLNNDGRSIDGASQRPANLYMDNALWNYMDSIHFNRRQRLTQENEGMLELFEHIATIEYTNFARKVTMKSKVGVTLYTL